VTHVFLLQKWMNNTKFFSQFQHLWRLPWAWNNQNKYISKGHEPTMTRTCLDLSPNHGTQIPRIRTWSVQVVNLNITLIWKNEKKKSDYGVKLFQKLVLNILKVTWRKLPPCIPFRDLIQQKKSQNILNQFKIFQNITRNFLR